MWWFAASTAWPTVIGLGGLVIAVPTAVVSALSFRRTAHVADVATATAAQQVGLDYMRESLKTQQDTIVRQQGEIGELRGELRSCRSEREALAADLAELRSRFDEG